MGETLGRPVIGLGYPDRGFTMAGIAEVAAAVTHDSLTNLADPSGV